MKGDGFCVVWPTGDERCLIESPHWLAIRCEREPFGRFNVEWDMDPGAAFVFDDAESAVQWADSYVVARVVPAPPEAVAAARKRDTWPVPSAFDGDLAINVIKSLRAKVADTVSLTAERNDALGSCAHYRDLAQRREKELDELYVDLRRKDREIELLKAAAKKGRR